MGNTYRIFEPFILLFIIVIIGVGGYMLIEHYTLLESLYMTVISLTTVGYGEVRPLTNAGRIFTILLLIGGWLTLALVISRLTQAILSRELQHYLKARKIHKAMHKLNEHVIICGYGRNGQQAAATLRAHHIPFVVIESDHEHMEKIVLDDKHLIYLEGDGTDDAILQKAGVDVARALITTLPVDAHNLYIVLSARTLSPKLQIISRASNHSAVAKLRKAGANEVIMPDRIGGLYMATLISRPDIIQFLELLSGEEGEGATIDAISYENLSQEEKDRTLDEIMQQEDTTASCIGVRHANGEYVINPAGSIRIKHGMKIIVLGTRAEITKLQKRFKND